MHIISDPSGLKRGSPIAWHRVASRASPAYPDRMDQTESGDRVACGLVVLPDADGQHLFRCRDDRLEDSGLITSDHEALVCLSDDRLHVGVVAQAGKRVRLLRVESGGIQTLGSPVDLPRGCYAKAIALKNDVLFVSTENGHRVPEERLWSRASGDGQWTPLPTAPELQFDRKCFDELLIDGDRLIAVDDIVLPKYFVEYDISSAIGPSITATKELGAHMSYEEVYAAALGTRWLAVASEGMNYGDGWTFLSLYGARDLHERSSYVRNLGQHGEVSEPIKPGCLGSCRGLAFAGDVLFLAGDDQGVGVLDLSEIDPDALEPLDLDVCAEAPKPGTPIEYHDVADRVIDVRTASNLSGCIAILQRDDDPPTWRRFSL